MVLSNFYKSKKFLIKMPEFIIKSCKMIDIYFKILARGVKAVLRVADIASGLTVNRFSVLAISLEFFIFVD